jgi:type II secretory pathway component GspD/PulD (secretin)
MNARRRFGAGVLALALTGAPTMSAAARPARAPEAERSSGGTSCVKLPAGKRVKLNLKPDTEVADLVAWISSITCRQFVLPDLPASKAKVTIVAPSPLTSREAYGLFLEALDSVGLTVYPAGPFLRIVETHSAKSSPVPVIGFDG